MRIRNKYNVDASDQMLSLLNRIGLPYKKLINFNLPTLQFHIYDDDCRKAEIDANLIGWNLIIPELVFSKEEYENAEWYRFMPKYDRVSSCDSPLTYSYFCKKTDGTIDYDSTHLHQVGYYRLDKKPNWSKGLCILSSEGNYDHKWFTNDTTREYLEQMNIQGFHFDPVIHGRSEQPLLDIWQVKFDDMLSEDALVLGKEYGIQSVISCISCQEKRYYVCPQTYQLCLYKECLKDKDVYMTQAVFGQGYGYRMVVGSKKLYQAVTESSLSKCFNIHPIKLIK